MAGNLNLIKTILAGITVESMQTRLFNSVNAAFIESMTDAQSEYGWLKIAPDPQAIEDMENRIILLSESTTDRLKGNLRYELLEGMEEGESVDEIGRRIDIVFDGDEVNTERIARNEVITSAKAGRLEAYEAAGAWGREWVAAKGPRTCADCKKLDGQVAPMGSWFKHPTTGEDLISDMAHIQCRCTTVPIMNNPKEV